MHQHSTESNDKEINPSNKRGKKGGNFQGQHDTVSKKTIHHVWIISNERNAFVAKQLPFKTPKEFQLKATVAQICIFLKAQFDTIKTK